MGCHCLIPKPVILINYDVNCLPRCVKCKGKCLDNKMKVQENFQKQLIYMIFIKEIEFSTWLLQLSLNNSPWELIGGNAIM